MRKSSIKPVVIVLLLVGLLPLAIKAFVLRVPLLPSQAPTSWRVEARVSFIAKDTRANLILQIPKRHPGFQITNENYVSDGFSLATSTHDDNRTITWTRKRARGPYDLYYEVTLRPLASTRTESTDPPSEFAPPVLEPEMTAAAEGLLKRFPSKNLREQVELLSAELLHPTTAEAKTLMGARAPSTRPFERALRQVLAVAQIPTQRVRGLDLQKSQHNLPLRSWLEIWDGASWKEFDSERGVWGVPRSYCAWWRGSERLLRSEGVDDDQVAFAVTSVDENSIPEQIARSAKKGWTILYTLPPEIQAVYKIILLIPLGGLLIAFLRNIIGIDTYGTFMPVLVALAFRETRLVWGIVLFTVVVAMGLVARFYFEKLSLLLIPRLASTLTVVILLLVAISTVATLLSFDRSPSVALFPMVIITMTIERMSVQWEEAGGTIAVRMGAMTLFAATLVYLLITNALVEYLFFTFPELLFVVLALSILLGRYTGYRLLELKRFWPFVKGRP